MRASMRTFQSQCRTTSRSSRLDRRKLKRRVESSTSVGGGLQHGRRTCLTEVAFKESTTSNLVPSLSRPIGTRESLLSLSQLASRLPRVHFTNATENGREIRRGLRRRSARRYKFPERLRRTVYKNVGPLIYLTLFYYNSLLSIRYLYDVF